MRLVSVFAAALLAALALPELAFAQEGPGGGFNWGIGVGAGVAIGFAVLGAGIGQGMAVGGTVQGIARNPGAAGQIQTPMIIGLAFIESLALFALIIAFLLQGKA
jgi:F-type H+-transporting ATPase subunit c